MTARRPAACARRALKELGKTACSCALVLAGAGVAWLVVTAVTETWRVSPGWAVALSCACGGFFTAGVFGLVAEIRS